MANENLRSEIYADLADRLTKTCVQGLDTQGRSILELVHGAPSIGHIGYGVGELSRCRPGLELGNIHGRDLMAVMQFQVENELDLDNEVHRCFVSMGLGLMGPADADHPVLSRVTDDQRNDLRSGLVVTRSFNNNWEAFNGCVLMGRHALYGTPAEDVLAHFEKIAAKYDETGYFDDTAGLGNYNNYGLMSINYPLRAAEFLDVDHPVRQTIEQRFKPHALRYVELIQALVSPKGDTWPFGRSAGVLGNLQCMVLLEQCLSRNWIAAEQVNPLRSLARQAARRMQDLYWDDDRQWFNFRDDYQRGYNYRASFPMAWDMLRYFLQLEEYAAQDEGMGLPEKRVPFHAGAGHREVVTHPELKTAIYIWSDGKDHAVLPIMAGPGRITGDTLARPYAPGLFEWTTQTPIPVLCPRLTIGGEEYWPGWHADRTQLAVDGETHSYTVSFRQLHASKGAPCPHAISCDSRFEFSSGAFRRIDTWRVGEAIEIDEFALEVLQPEPHPHRSRFGDVHKLSVSWQSDVEGLELVSRDVCREEGYVNYHCRHRQRWHILAGPLKLHAGTHTTQLTLRW